MAGLTPRRYRELLDEHGSRDAVIAWADEADPELAVDLGRRREVSKALASQFAAFRSSPELPAPAQIVDLGIERQAIALEKALARHARSEARKRIETTTRPQQLSDKQKLLYKHYKRRTFASVLARLEQNENVAAIAEAEGLKRQDVDKNRAWRDDEVYDAIRGQLPNTVILVKRPKTA